MTTRRAIAVGIVSLAAGAAAVASPHRRHPRLEAGSGSGSGGGGDLQYDGSAISVQTPVGQMQTVARPITNAGAADVTLAAAQIVPTSGSGTAWTFGGYDYGCAGMSTCTLAPGAFTDATPTFTPPDLGVYTADLMISADDGEMVFLELSGVGLGARISGPSTLPLGGTPVTTTLAGAIHLANSGNLAQSYTATASGDPEIAVGSGGAGSVDPSGSTDVPITCTPTAVAAYAATVHVATPGALSPDLDVDVTCSGTDGVLRADPSVVDFGEVRIGVGATRTVMLTRVGSGAPLELDDPAFDDPAPDGITVGAPSSATVASAPPTTFDLTVTADPTAAEGALHGHITVTAHGDGVDSHAPVDVSARLVTASYTVPDTLDAGTYCIGAAPRPTNAALASTGTATLQLSAPAFAGTGKFAITDVLPVQYPAALAPGGTATVQITPIAQATAQTVTDTLAWTTDVAGAQTAHTTVTATFVADGAAISPQHVDFGSVAVTQASPPRTITIENCSTTPLMLEPAILSASDAFANVSVTPLPAMLAPTELATVQVQFTPRRMGGAMAVLTVESSKGPLTVTLVGTGIGGDAGDSEKTSFYACSAAGAPTGALLLGVGLFAYRRRRGPRR